MRGIGIYVYVFSRLHIGTCRGTPGYAEVGKYVDLPMMMLSSMFWRSPK